MKHTTPYQSTRRLGSRVRFSSAALVAAALSASPVYAAEFAWDASLVPNNIAGFVSWDGTQAGGSGTNWNRSGLPGMNDTVLFDDRAPAGNRRVNLNGDRTVLSATFNSSILADRPPGLNYLLDETPGQNTLTLLDGDLTVLDGNALINSNVSLASAGDWDIASGSTLDLGGALGGNQDLTKSGDGTLNLTGGGEVNNLVVNQGALVNSGGTFNVNNLSSTGNLRVAGGTINLTGDSSVSDLTLDAGGRFTFSGATFAVRSNLSGSGTLRLDGGANLTFGGGNGSSTFSGVIEGDGSLTKTGGGQLTLSGANTYTGTTNLDLGVLVLTGGNAINDAGAVVVNDLLVVDDDETIGSLSGFGGVALNLGSLTINDSADRTFDGFFSGAQDLTLSGSGAMTLTGASSNTGTININGTSTLRLANAFGATLADSVDVSIGANGTLELAVDETIGALGGAGDVSLGSNTLTLTEAGSYDGVISGDGNLTLNGSGTQTLTGVSTFTGTTTIGGTSTLRLANAGGDTLADSVDVVIGANGTLELVTDDTIGGLSGSGNVLLGANTLTINNSADHTFSGVIEGDGSLTKTGDGTLVLIGAQTYTGPTRALAGLLDLSQTTAFASTLELRDLVEGRLVTPSGGVDFALGENLTASTDIAAGSIRNLDILAGNTLALPASIAMSETLTNSGTVVVSGGTVTAADLVNDGDLDIDSGLVTVAGRTALNPGSVVNLNGGRFEFGVMDFESFANINGVTGSLAGAVDDLVLTGLTDIVTVNSALLVDNIAPEVDVSEVVIGGVTNQGFLFGAGSLEVDLLNDTSGEIEVITGERMLINGPVTNLGRVTLAGGQFHTTQAFINRAGGRVIGVGGLRADGGIVNDGTMQFGDTANVIGGVTNNVSGLIFSAGGTTTFFNDVVNHGEVRTFENSFTVFLGGVSGSGSYTGEGTVIFAGSFSPGNSPGVVKFDGDANFTADNEFNIELGGTEIGEYDRLEIAGDMLLDGFLDVSLLAAFDLSLGQAFEIIDVEGMLSGRFVGLDQGALIGTFGGVDLVIDYFGGDGNDVVLTAVPEPASLALLAAGGLLMARRNRG